MPRGKYPRKPAAMDSAPQVQALPQPAIAQEPVVVLDMPGLKLFSNGNAVISPVALAAPASVRGPHRFADHAKSRDIDRLPVDELRVYARQIGMTLRDCAELSEPRLRAGCRSHISNHFDALTE